MLLMLDIITVLSFRRQRETCYVIHDKVALKRATLLSKFIFTGKVFSVNTVNNARVYKVNIRRVLKGDLNDIGVVVRFGKAKSLRFSDATVLVESLAVSKCPPLRVRTYAIFLTEKRRERDMVSLRLVVEPVLLTLKNLEIIDATIKGIYDNSVLLPNYYLFNILCTYLYSAS